MAGFKEYDKYDGLGLAKLVKEKKISPKELCEEAIYRIEKLNPRLNAVIRPMFDISRKAAEKGLPSGPFTGVPFLLKDLLHAYKGVPYTKGSKAYKNYIPDYDSELVLRYKKAGLNIIGKTNTPEFGLLGITEPEVHGPTRNPWDLEYTPGGSSGGSASAVAAFMTPMASGGDGGGSIRIPSSYCGLFGMKTSRGRTPSGPKGGRIWQGAVVEHVITWSVRDSAAILDVTEGPDSGCPFSIDRPRTPYLSEMKKKPGKLKVAFTTDHPLGKEVDPEYREAVKNTALLLESLGHYVEEATPPINNVELAESYLSMYLGETAADIYQIEEDLQRKVRKRDVEPATWLLGALGKKFSSFDFVMVMRQWDKAARQMGEFHKKYDLFCTPTNALPPVKVGELSIQGIERAAIVLLNMLHLSGLLKVTGVLHSIFMQSMERYPFTQIANFTGQPAVSIPLHISSDGMPIGTQLIAPFGDEATLFKVAHQLEKARPWFGNRPGDF